GGGSGGKPKTVMHDNGKQFTSRIFKHFLVHNHIKDKRIPSTTSRIHLQINQVTPSNHICDFILGWLTQE
ncbi:MAG: hypothetical protein WA941_19875, partial [Nitrososphaeraceae archaeon]